MTHWTSPSVSSRSQAYLPRHVSFPLPLFRLQFLFPGRSQLPSTRPSQHTRGGGECEPECTEWTRSGLVGYGIAWAPKKPFPHSSSRCAAPPTAAHTSSTSAYAHLHSTKAHDCAVLHCTRRSWTSVLSSHCVLRTGARIAQELERIRVRDSVCTGKCLHQLGGNLVCQPASSVVHLA